MSYNKISYEIKDNIAYIGFGMNEEKSMTTLTEEVMLDFDKGLDEVATSSAKGLVLFSHIPNCFIAGADIGMISRMSTGVEAAQAAEKGQTVANKIEDLKIPTIACVDGACLGGGLELALACDTIICSDSNKTKLGLPEVKLGLLPGCGGTYRLPKRVGLPGSLDLILTGKMLNGKRAKKMCLVDFVMPKERLIPLAPQFMGKKNPKLAKRSIKDRLVGVVMDSFPIRKFIFHKAKETVLKSTKGFYPAPLRILDVLESTYGRKRKKALTKEARAFGELSQTSQSASLRHLFFLHDNSKKFDKGSKALKKVGTGAVLGAGTMGGGIAWLFAKNGQKPYMKDINKDALELGLKQSSKIFTKALKRRRISKDKFAKMQWSIAPTLNYDGFKGVDLLIEAVVENMDLKKKVFAEVEQQVTKDCLLTSNTSSLSVNEMAKALEHPERFAGLHFFNPVHMMPLVEIIKHDKVSDHTIQSLYDWCLKVGKTPVVVKDGPGFLVNRILMPMINESAYLLEEGVSIECLDRAILNFGMPMGACRLMDEVGIDVLVKVAKIMQDGLGARAKAGMVIKDIFDAGFLGKKNNKGFYRYDEKGKEIGVNEDVRKFLPKKKKVMDETLIQMRVFLPMVNEAASIISDGIVENAAVVDLALIFGIGFPPFRGGLLRYADAEGLDRIVDALNDFSETVDKDRYTPCDMLKKLAAGKKKFYDN